MTQKGLQSFPLLALVVCLLTLIRGQYEPYGENVALNKHATQSTTYQDYSASLGVDGNTETDFDRKTCSHTDTGGLILDAWWIVYLGEFYFIKFITIFQPKNLNRLNGATMYVKVEEGTSHEIQLTSHWLSTEFNVSVLLDKRINEIKLYNNKKPPLDSPMISVCELQAHKVLECSPYTFANGCIEAETLGEKSQTFTYGAKLKLSCNEGYEISEKGMITNETKSIVECKATKSWSRNLSCSVIDCGQPRNIPYNSTVISSTGLAGNTTYNATMRVSCDKGFNYTLPGNEIIRCTDGGKWMGILGHCKVTRCTEIVPPEYGVIVVEAGTGGRWSFNTTVVIICNTGYSLNGETLIKCLETGRWTNALGYCLALPEKYAEAEECKTSVLGWVITGPFCLILLVSNIATCLRFHGHKNSDMQTLNNKSNELENNAMEPYDNLQMGQIAKSEYDQLAFERESSLKTAMKEI